MFVQRVRLVDPAFKKRCTYLQRRVPKFLWRRPQFSPRSSIALPRHPKPAQRSNRQLRQGGAVAPFQQQSLGLIYAAILACSAAILELACRRYGSSTPPANPKEGAPSQPTSPLPPSFPPPTPDYSAMPTPPGHLGNLAPDQEAKLRALWLLVLRTFGVTDSSMPNGTAEGASESGAETPSNPSADKEKKKKRLSLFPRRGDRPNDSASSSPRLATVDDDKYGQVKEFHDVLEKQTPEELRTAFWRMVKCDHPDALLLRFLRARKWDIDKALVMLVATMHWRSSIMHVDDDVIFQGEGGALGDLQSKDASVQKDGEDFLAQLRLGKSFLHGTDKAGRPLCIVRVRLHKPGEQTERSMERYTVYTIETARLVLRPPVETAVSILSNHLTAVSRADKAWCSSMLVSFC